MKLRTVLVNLKGKKKDNTEYKRVTVNYKCLCKSRSNYESKTVKTLTMGRHTKKI